MSKKKIVIIIPYRNRSMHLERYLNTMSELMSDKEYHILIIEQANQLPFNSGIMRNIGFKEAIKRYPDQTWFVFNDIDIVPSSPDQIINFKDPDNQIIHLYGLRNCLGGVYVISRENFEKSNGYPTGYWGWGFEDTDFWHYRIKPLELTLIGPLYQRFNKDENDIGFLDDSKHPRDLRFRGKNKKLFESKESPGGLDSTEYRIVDEKHGENYILIRCDFDQN